MTELDLWEFRPGHQFTPGRCRCGLCVVGSYWALTHCGSCGKPRVPHSWDAFCEACNNPGVD